MISRIEAYKYRCFEKLDVELDNFRVLVGANGSGKSTILDVVPFGPPSPVFKEIASTVSIRSCKDGAFNKMRGALRGWFPPEQ